MPPARLKPLSALRRFLDGQSSAGLVLMAAAAAALLLANSPAAPLYGALLEAHIGPLSVAHWINDGLMAVFFLLVGLEIKREALVGQLSTWPRRILPGAAAAGGMVVPALIYLAIARGPAAAGWAIPTATDIAFALGVIALVGPRVPASLRIFLAALAIIDDLGAVLVIALVYTGGISLPFLIAAVAAAAALALLNRRGVQRLAPYLLLGLLLWWLVLQSGVHATLAGVVLAFTIPLGRAPGERSPLHRLERALHRPVGFVVVPVFGLANAGIALTGLPAGTFAAPAMLGIALGLVIGKTVGVFGAATLAIRAGWAERPAHATRAQMLGVALLCGIGFTMSLFITLLAFPDAPLFQAEAKLGILIGSLVAGLLGYTVLRVSGSRAAPPTPRPARPLSP